MSKRFFKPFVGSKYNEGIRGKKILVLGASFYCNKDGKNGREKCEYFTECTNPEKKDSSKFDVICPVYKNTGLLLSEEPSNAISENYKAYRIFGKFIKRFIKNQEEDVWQRMAFTDYLQFFSPTTKTKKSYLSERDFESFRETLIELQPDIVIAWGMAIIEKIRDENPFVNKDMLRNTEWYVCHMKMPEINHEISLICCYHPSAPKKYWDGELDKLTKYMEEELK